MASVRFDIEKPAVFNGFPVGGSVNELKDVSLFEGVELFGAGCPPKLKLLWVKAS